MSAAQEPTAHAAPDEVRALGGVPVLVCAADGPVLRDQGDALDIVGTASYLGAHWAAVPVSRIDGDFFRLRTGVAGEILQKFVNYRMGLAVVGDVSPYTEASTALRDLVRESNRGRHAWFVLDLADLERRLAATTSS